jgi:hypothetical protein
MARRRAPGPDRCYSQAQTKTSKYCFGRRHCRVNNLKERQGEDRLDQHGDVQEESGSADSNGTLRPNLFGSKRTQKLKGKRWPCEKRSDRLACVRRPR